MKNRITFISAVFFTVLFTVGASAESPDQLKALLKNNTFQQRLNDRKAQVNALQGKIKPKNAKQVTVQSTTNDPFYASLRGMTPMQKARAISAHKMTQLNAQKAQLAKMHNANVAALKKSLDSNKKLTAAQKNDLINAYEGVNNKPVDHTDAIALSQIANNPGLSQKQKKTAVRNYILTTRKARLKGMIGNVSALSEKMKTARLAQPKTFPTRKINLPPTRTFAPVTREAAPKHHR